MKIVLKQGESIRVTLADSDGEFVIKFGKNKVSVKADLPDTQGREGVIYEEKFGSLLEDFPFGWSSTT